MKVLFTGGSSFTGYWFIRCLAEAGHEVVAVFRRPLEGYEGVRRRRVERLESQCRAVHGCSFGDRAFLDLIDAEDHWDALCHHAADVTDYKSDEFDLLRATANNTTNVRQVLAALAQKACRKVAVTGSVFEGGEGAGSQGLPAFSPYGLSKQLSWQIIEFWGSRAGFRLGKLVIPCPFGPFEDPRFTHYLVQTWCRGETPSVRTPDYVRDNIHVSLLAAAYVDFVETLPAAAGVSRLGPSGYIESQGRFAERFAENMRSRLDLSCPLMLGEQHEFPEPRIRVNTDPLDTSALGWSESAAWDELADYYRDTYGCRGRAAAQLTIG